MRIRLSVLAAAGLMLPAGALFAEPVAECHAAAKSRAEVATCLSRRLQEAEREMDDLVASIHRQVHAGPSPAAFQTWRSFDDAQGMFVAYRGVTCNWQYNQAGADGSEQLRACMIRLTQQRNQELRDWLTAQRH